MNDVTAVIVNYNSGTLLGVALDALPSQRLASVIVVDNASTDGSQLVAVDRDDVEFHQSHINMGFARAMNYARRWVKTPYLFSLNADVVLAADYVEHLVRALEADPGAAGATGVLRLPDGSIDSTGIECTTARWGRDRDRGRATATLDAPFGVSGAACLWRVEALAEVTQEQVDCEGPWWNELFVYGEDIELAWRLHRAGWHRLTAPEATGQHARGADRADPTFVEAASFGGRLAMVARHEGVAGLVAPASLAATLVVAARLAVRHPRALRQARPWAKVRAGLNARWFDRRWHGWPVADPHLFVPHPWGEWVRSQLGRDRAGGAAAPLRRMADLPGARPGPPPPPGDGAERDDT